MDKDDVLREWYKYVRENYNRLKQAVTCVTSGERELLLTRQIMAELGHEITPQELKDFAEILSETLEAIENDADLYL